MLNYGKSHADSFGTIDLIPSMEPMETKPLLNGHIIQTNNKQFRVERYQWHINDIRNHCYVFVDITMGGKLSKSFAKAPSYVEQAIKDKKIVIKNVIFP